MSCFTDQLYRIYLTVLALTVSAFGISPADAQAVDYPKKIFVSVGRTATEEQEQFVRAVEERLRSEGFEPQTVGRNHFSSNAPLKTIINLMDECHGTVIIALERTYFPSGYDRHGGKDQKPLKETRLPTTWNQIEAAMAYARDQPLLVIVEDGLKSEGLLESSYDWYVQHLKLNQAALSTPEFNGVFADWKNRVLKGMLEKDKARTVIESTNPLELSIEDLLRLRPSQLWSILVALGGIATGSFTLGVKIGRRKKF